MSAASLQGPLQTSHLYLLSRRGPQSRWAQGPWKQRPGYAALPKMEGMRVTVVTSVYPALSQTFVADHVRRLSDEGHEVTVLASAPIDAEASDSDTGPNSGARVVYRATSSTPRTTKAGHYGTLGRVLATRPSALVRTLRRSLAEQASLATITSYVAGLERVGMQDLIHCHFGPVGLAVVDALEVLRMDTPLVTTFHGYDVTRHLRHTAATDYRRLFARGDAFLPVSEYFHRRLVSIGAPSAKTRVHYLGVDTERLRPVGAGRGDHGPMRVLMVGRLVEKKGFKYGLRAIAVARASGCDIETTVVGDGPLRSELQTEAERLGIAASTRLAGSMDRQEVAREMADSDVLLAPSHEAADGDMEGIPVVILEAMAIGLPVVSSFHSGIPEAVLDGHTGLLAPERDSERLGSHLARLGSDPHERVRMGAAGRTRVMERHDASRQARELESIYWSVRDQRRGSKFPVQPT